MIRRSKLSTWLAIALAGLVLAGGAVVVREIFFRPPNDSQG